MGDSVGYYNWEVKFNTFPQTEDKPHGAITIPRELVPERNISEPVGDICYQLIPEWVTENKCIQVIEKEIKK